MTVLKTFDVVYVVSRTETYRVEAESAEAASLVAFEEGKLVDEGETYSCEQIDIEEVQP